MFKTARLKLTAWYLLIIMLVSGLFSTAFYHTSTREIQRLIDRVKLQQQLEEEGAFFPLPPRFRGFPDLEELEAIKRRFLMSLVMINGAILVFAGGAGYFLAGRTLRPIETMMEEQNQFISNASHELRTPLATLRAELESTLMEKRLTDKQARVLIASNLEEVGTLQSLSNDLLRLTQVHAYSTGAVPQFKSVPLTAVIKAAVKRVKPLAARKHLTLTLHLSEISLDGEAHSLTELFVILLDNAIKYSPESETIRLIAGKNERHAIVEVIDRGVGIAKADLPHIFKRFYRADKSRSRAEGFGLGLSIAQKIVALHHGSISVSSQPGKGSVFTVSLPLTNSGLSLS